MSDEAVALSPVTTQKPRRSPLQLVAVIPLLVAASLVPFVASSFHLLQLAAVVIYSIALLGLNILTGYNGQISLGHGAFFAVGAYVTAILLERTGIPYWATIPLAGAVCLLVGFL